MTAVLVDDEELNVELLVNLLTKYCPGVDIVGEAYCVEDALEVIQNANPDVVLLDIELHNKTAKDILNAICLDSIQIILISAFEKYALEMHKYPITDYLLKPILITDLIGAINKVQKNLDKQKLVFTNTVNEADKYIALPEKNHLNISNTEDIIRLEAQGNYTKIFAKHDREIMSSKPIREYEQLLPQNKFIRIHNSHIVNLQYVSKYIRTKTGALELIDGTKIPISASRKKDITNRIVF